MPPSHYSLESRGLNAQQVAKVREFRIELQSYGLWDAQRHDEHDAARFLKARNYDLHAAKAMWEAMLAWRREMRADTIHEWFNFPERDAYNKIYPTGLHQVDREGHPVLIQRLGRVDLKALYKVTSEERLKLHHVREYEHLRALIFPACSRVAGRHIDQLFIIIDLDGISFTDMMRTRTLLTMFMKMDSDNYPEILYRMVIINAPGWFSNMWSSIKSFMSGDTPKKIEIVGKDFRQVLLQYITRENLLPDYGGTSAGALTDNVGPWQGVNLAKIAEEVEEGDSGSDDELTRATSGLAGSRPMDIDSDQPVLPAGPHAGQSQGQHSGVQSAAASRNSSPTRPRLQQASDKAHAVAAKLTTTAKAAAAAARDIVASVKGNDREHKLDAPLLGKHYRSGSVTDTSEVLHVPQHISVDVHGVMQTSGMSPSAAPQPKLDTPSSIPWDASPQATGTHTGHGSSGSSAGGALLVASITVPHPLQPSNSGSIASAMLQPTGSSGLGPSSGGGGAMEGRERPAATAGYTPPVPLSAAVLDQHVPDQDKDLARTSGNSVHSFYSAMSEYPSSGGIASPQSVPRGYERDPSFDIRRFSRDHLGGTAIMHSHMSSPQAVLAPSRAGTYGGGQHVAQGPGTQSPMPVSPIMDCPAAGTSGMQGSGDSPADMGRIDSFNGDTMEQCGFGPAWPRSWFRRRQYRNVQLKYGPDLEPGSPGKGQGQYDASLDGSNKPTVYYAKHALHPDYCEFDSPSPVTDQMLSQTSEGGFSFGGPTPWAAASSSNQSLLERRRLLAGLEESAYAARRTFCGSCLPRLPGCTVM